MDNKFQNFDYENRIDDEIESKPYGYSVDYIWWIGIIIFGSIGLLFLGLA